jgi:hypothetical protein
MILSKDAVNGIQEELKKLEGVSEGLGIFHPRVGHYIKQRVDAIARIVYEEPIDFSKLNTLGKPEYSVADREVAEHPEDYELAPDGDYPVRKKKQEIKGKIEEKKILA